MQDEAAEAVVVITDGPRSADVRREVEATVRRSLQPGVRLHAVSLGLRSVHKDTINYLKRIAYDWLLPQHLCIVSLRTSPAPCVRLSPPPPSPFFGLFCFGGFGGLLGLVWGDVLIVFRCDDGLHSP